MTPTKWPDFHEKIYTTGLQPETPLSTYFQRIHNSINSYVKRDYAVAKKLSTSSMTDANSWAILAHSSPDLTNKVYTNVDPVLQHGVDQISAKELNPMG
jgi:hypothetical protein